MIDGFQDSFREEAYELLENLEQALLQLEDAPDDRDVVSAVFRSMHTIKGSAAMFGFDAVSGFTHHVETVLDDVRNGKIPVTRGLIDLTLESRDHIRLMLDDPEHESIPERSQALMKRLEEEVDRAQGDREPLEIDGEVVTHAIGDENGSAAAPPPPQQEGAGEALARTWHIRFVPHTDIMSNGTNPLLLLEELHDLGDCTVVAGLSKVPPLEQFSAEATYTTWDVFLTTTQPSSAIRDVFMFVDDQCDLQIRLVDEIDFSDEPRHKRLGQILIDRGVVESDVVRQAVSEQRRLGEVLVGSGVDAHEVETALQEQEHIKRSRQKVQADAASSSIRVQSDKLDELVDLVGELVTLQARLTQTTDGVEHTELTTISENFERLIGELRDHTMSIRMVPIATSFSRFRRLVRDLSQELGKDVELTTEGGETELDKTVIERLHDPLVHVIRNSIDHGLESPEQRKAAGKSKTGNVSLSARHAGANVEVRVVDDGKGLDREAIRQRAVERGLIGSDAQFGDSEVFDLVFQPGFSTAAAVTTVSGRGVGMDVVRKEVENIGGTVTLHSVPGNGTTIVISIPLTLAIIDGLLVRIGGEHFVVPLSNVEECIEYRRGSSNDAVVANRGELLPLIDLRHEFGISGNRPEIEQAVVVETGIGEVGFVVDTVIGDHQTVIKNLGKLYHNLEGVSGATILGDGGVALILDVQRLAAGKSNGGHHT
ncbi:MAG: chemotaxis protein CheA [Spirochaeta sp.]|jgi:two-component system chemotaxis sensor kinase CheA|nr:chemotaxis protein CheA [Spirochaeta sp.]